MALLAYNSTFLFPIDFALEHFQMLIFIHKSYNWASFQLV